MPSLAQLRSNQLALTPNSSILTLPSSTLFPNYKLALPITTRPPISAWIITPYSVIPSCALPSEALGSAAAYQAVCYIFIVRNIVLLIQKQYRMITIHHDNNTFEDKSPPSNNPLSPVSSAAASLQNDSQTTNRSKSLSMSYNVVLENKNSPFSPSNSTGSKSVRGAEEQPGTLTDQKHEQAINNKFCSLQLENIDSVTFKEIERIKSIVMESKAEETKACEGAPSKSNRITVSRSQPSPTISHITQQLSTVRACLNQVGDTIAALQLKTKTVQEIEAILSKINLETLFRKFEKLVAENLHLQESLLASQSKLREAGILVQEHNEKIRNLKRLYRQVVLERQKILLEKYHQSKKRLEQNTTSKEEITFLKTMIHKIKPVKSRAQLMNKDSQATVRAETMSQVEKSEKLDEDDQLLAGIDKSDMTLAVRYGAPQFQELEEETIKNRRKESASEISNDFFFEIDKSESGMKNTIQKLKQRIEELEFQLKIKEEALSAIYNLVDDSAEELNIKDQAKMLQVLKRQQVKEKLSSSLKLAQENAYLKKCMEKLSKSQVFWSKFQTPVQIGEEKRDGREKCLLF